MHSNRILDSIANLLVRHMVFVGIKEDRLYERPRQLDLRSKRDILVPPYDLQSRKSCCCLGYPGKNLGF